MATGKGRKQDTSLSTHSLKENSEILEYVVTVEEQTQKSMIGLI